MDRLHRKSALAATTGIILSSHEHGEGLLWERYEKQLPLCAFTNNGLNCRKCLNGPCRINPFGDEPSQGVCGAGRDQIVMENLFQTTVEGLLQTARSLSLETGESSGEIPDISPDLPSETEKRLSDLGLLPVRKRQVFEAQNSYFSHRGYLSETLIDLTRLGLIHYGFLKEAQSHLSRLFGGEESFSQEGVNLLVIGKVPFRLLERLRSQADQQAKGKTVNIFVGGGGVPSLSQAFADQGTAELALAMNVDGLILSPDAFRPALEGLAERFNIPLILAQEGKTLDQVSHEAIKEALRHSQTGSYMTRSRMGPAFHGPARSRLFEKEQGVRAALEGGELRGVVVILGEANVKQTFFERTLTLIKNCLEGHCLVLLGGEMGVHLELLREELSRVLGGELEGLSRLGYFGSSYDIPEIVAFFRDIGQGKGFDTLPVAIAFPEFFKTSSWADAVSFLSLGFGVQIGTHLPFWGSPPLTEVLIKEWPKISGGTFMASPILPDGRAQAEELLSFLSARRMDRNRSGAA